MKDVIKTYTLKDFPVRVHIAFMRKSVQKMNQLHETTPTAAAAAGRTLIATALMGSMLKNDTDVVTATVRADGPIGRITATANNKVDVKCEILNPFTPVKFNQKGKLDVSATVGRGELTVIKDIGMKQPYVGQVELVSGEIAEDFTYYYAKSEQTPSVVSLGVFVTKDLIVSDAGGFVIQLMPDCDDEIIDFIEKKVENFPTFTSLMQAGYSPEGIMKELFEEYAFQQIGEKEVSYFCDCSMHKIDRLLLALGKKELESIIADNTPIEIVCHFCNKKYEIPIEHIKEIYASSQQKECE